MYNKLYRSDQDSFQKILNDQTRLMFQLDNIVGIDDPIPGHDYDPKVGYKPAEYVMAQVIVMNYPGQIMNGQAPFSGDMPPKAEIKSRMRDQESFTDKHKLLMQIDADRMKLDNMSGKKRVKNFYRVLTNIIDNICPIGKEKRDKETKKVIELPKDYSKEDFRKLMEQKLERNNSGLLMIKGTQSDRSDTYMNLINEYGGYMTKENKVIADALSGKAEKKREKKANSKLASSQTIDKISESQST